MTASRRQSAPCTCKRNPVPLVSRLGPRWHGRRLAVPVVRARDVLCSNQRTIFVLPVCSCDYPQVRRSSRRRRGLHRHIWCVLTCRLHEWALRARGLVSCAVGAGVLPAPKETGCGAPKMCTTTCVGGCGSARSCTGVFAHLCPADKVTTDGSAAVSSSQGAVPEAMYAGGLYERGAAGNAPTYAEVGPSRQLPVCLCVGVQFGVIV